MDNIYYYYYKQIYVNINIKYKYVWWIILKSAYISVKIVSGVLDFFIYYMKHFNIYKQLWISP